MRTQALDGLTVGVIVNDAITEGSDEATIAVFDDAVAALTAAGATAKRIEVPLYDELAAGAFLGLQAEAFAWHRDRLAARWEDYGRPTRLTIVQGALISAADIVQIERVRQVAQPPAMAQRRLPGEAPKRCRFAACTHRHGTAPVGRRSRSRWVSIPMGCLWVYRSSAGRLPTTRCWRSVMPTST